MSVEEHAAADVEELSRSISGISTGGNQGQAAWAQISSVATVISGNVNEDPNNLVF